jgi:hypothetical protein
VGAAVVAQLVANEESTIHAVPSPYFQVPPVSLRSEAVKSSE